MFTHAVKREMVKERYMIKELMIQYHKIYIVGAQSRAKTLSGYITFLYPRVSVEAYLVDAVSQNDADIQGIPVCKLEDTGLLQNTLPVFIATKSILHEEIQKKLHDMGFQTIIPVTFEIDNFLRNEYVKKYYEKEQSAFVKLTDLAALDEQYSVSSVIYIAKSIYDHPLQSNYVSPNYEKVIQAGAALTKERLLPKILTDCEGENISEKNRQYCELTVLYWIWKNAKEEIVGLSHYRRHFILPENWQNIMVSYKIDVILPVPTFVYPSIEENYKERHDYTDWEFLMRYLEKNSPDDYAMAKKVFSKSLYSPCNMFIMNRVVLNKLCSWMFPIVDAVALHGGAKADSYLNRYPGFISERLITLFFHKHKDDYKIAYVDKNFLT